MFDCRSVVALVMKTVLFVSSVHRVSWVVMQQGLLTGKSRVEYAKR